ncbi:RidA family protein [Actinokineospora sp. G85]|uniref:RidA family protein n=1 Tax=Actinokineospora sp. G85 TaxID=3406626 RepID=UPI003C774AB2
MAKNVDNPAGVPAPPPGRYAHVNSVDVGDSTLLFLSGQCSVDDDLNVVAPHDVRGQSERIFEITTAILAAHGATWADVVNIRTYMTDLGKRAEYGEVRRRYLLADQLPTSTTVEVSALFLAEAVIEVEVMAVVTRRAGER